MNTTRRLLTSLGLASAVATGADAQPPGRAAVLLTPRPLDPAKAPAVARAAADDPPGTRLASTPVSRPGVVQPAGPAWLNTGPDPYVVRTGAVNWSRTTADAGPQPVVSLSPSPPRPVPAPAPPEPSLLSQGMTKLKGLTTDRPPSPIATAPTGPLPGTAGGAPILAGPPAMRWYGWGSVTPGANPYAPTGQYPRASANWYSVTGATPGAFPVPVMNPYRTAPGGEPPAYAQVPAGSRGPGVAGPAAFIPAPTPVRAPVNLTPPPPPPVVERPAVGVPTLGALPAMPSMTFDPLPVPVAPADAVVVVPASRRTDGDPAPLPVLSAWSPAAPVVPPFPPPTDEVRWQPGSAIPAAPLPTQNPPPAGPLEPARPPAVRGQMPDVKPR